MNRQIRCQVPERAKNGPGSNERRCGRKRSGERSRVVLHAPKAVFTRHIPQDVLGSGTRNYDAKVEFLAPSNRDSKFHFVAVGVNFQSNGARSCQKKVRLLRTKKVPP